MGRDFLLKILFFILVFGNIPFFGDGMVKTGVKKQQIPYLMQAGQVEKSVALYHKYREELGAHDFEILQQMALILLEQGARSSDRFTQLLSIYGSGIASVAASLDILEAGIKSQHAETQVAAIQFLGRMQDDRSDELLIKAMSSPFFYARMEAALQLANRKHRASVGQIESLMYRVPPPARFFFPQFFALIGTSDAIAILRHLMEDRVPSVRVEALLNAAKFGRDDLLPAIRMNITHLNVAEQEAAAFAVGILKDSRSIKKLRRIKETSTINVQLSAARSLYMLGDQDAKQFLIECAKQGNILAIPTLTDIPEAKETLAELVKSKDLAIRMNAAMALLKHRDSRCTNALLEILLKDGRDMGFHPVMSLGKTLLAFKPIYSTSQQSTEMFDYASATLSVRQQLLLDAMHLPEENFLTIGELIFDSRQTELVPTLVTLLESLQTPRAIDLLKRKSQAAGMPLMRAYCNLALYRLGIEGPYADSLISWIKRHMNSEMIRFKPLVTMDKKLDSSPFELTPEEGSRLLVEAYQTLSEKQLESSLEILLDSIENGNPKNRYVLAGLLLRTLQ